MSFGYYQTECPCFWCTQRRRSPVHPSVRGLPYAETVCVVCGRDNDAGGEMCSACIRWDEGAGL